MNKKVTILVACHKPDTVYRNDIYTPIHVGRAISKWKSEMADMIGDDTGDNISHKNPYYCELTAQYWAWKNLDCEYVGLCHYRRYFETEFTSENIDIVLGTQADVILSKPLVERQCMGKRLCLASCLEDFEIFMRCLKTVSPNMWNSCLDFLNSNVCYPYNMFVMKKCEFDKFASWQFAVLEEMEKYVRLSGYTRMRRVYGYMAEMMLPMWCHYYNKKIITNKITPMIGEKPYGYSSKMKDLYSTLLFKCLHDVVGLASEDNAIMVGFKNDGISFS